MADESAPAAKPTPGSPPNRLNLPLVILIFLTFTLGLLVWQRNTVLSHWWVYNIRNTDDLQRQAYDVTCLTAVGDSAAGALSSLAGDPRPEIQSLAILASQRLTPQRRLHLVLAPLMGSSDPDVRNAAATAIAFMDDHAAANYLAAASKGGPPQNMAAAAGLARVSASLARTTLCDLIAKGDSAGLRAQAAESIGQHLTSEINLSASEVELLVKALVNALSDAATFQGELALEREIRAVSAVVTGKKGFRVSTEPGADRPGEDRTVASVAANVLTDLTGQSVNPPAIRDQDDFARKCCEWIEQRRRLAIPTSREAEAVDLITSGAESPTSQETPP